MRIVLPPPPCITVHLLHDNTLAGGNREKFLFIGESYNQLIKFYNVEEICAAEISHIKDLFKNYPTFDRYTIGAIFRVLIPQALPNIEKAIYLDSDIIVNLDINELWRVELGDKPIASDPTVNQDREKKIRDGLCKDGFVAREDYFCSGVMVMNLKHIRQKELQNLEEGLQFIAKNPKYPTFDQEVLNYCFSKNYVKLPVKFDFYVLPSRNYGVYETSNRILHYWGQVLNCDMNDKFNRLWFSYFEKTPWFNKEVIAHLDEGYKQIINQKYAGYKNFALQVSALMSGKTRAFFADVSDIELMKQIFFVKDDEEIIPFINQESFQILADSMYNSRGKKIFFILFGDYEQLQAALTNAGFVEGEDFINAAMFLSDVNGIQLNTYTLIRNM